jgi:hypothetical protein
MRDACLSLNCRYSGYRLSYHADNMPKRPHPLQAGIQVGNACWELYCLEHG